VYDQFKHLAGVPGGPCSRHGQYLVTV
jgi:hypothetical protein